MEANQHTEAPAVIETTMIRAGTTASGELAVEVTGDPDLYTRADLVGAVVGDLMSQVTEPAEAMALANRLMAQVQATSG